MILAVDTNILLDILIPNTAYLQSSLSCLLSIGQDDELTICEAVYAELGSQFLSSQDLNRFLHDTAIRLVSSNEKSQGASCTLFIFNLRSTMHPPVASMSTRNTSNIF